jgi:hypothetical protein
MGNMKMRGATVVLLGVGSFAGVAAGQDLSFTTVLDSNSAIAGGGTDGKLSYIGQVVLQNDNALAAVVRFGPDHNAITFSPTPGGSTQVVVQTGDSPSTTFAASGGASFVEFYNLSSVGGNVTFASGEVGGTGERGLFRYAYDASSPQRTTLHFEGDAIGNANASLDTGAGPPAYDVNSAGQVIFGARNVPSGMQVIARRTGGATSTRIHDDAGSVANFNLPDSFFSTRKVLTNDGHAVFVADDGDAVHNDDGRRIYDIAPGAAVPAPQVRVEKSLLGGTYEPQRLLAATGAHETGITLFRAFKDRPAPGSPLPPGTERQEWAQGALLVQSPLGLTELASFDTSDGSSTPDLTAVMSENGRVAAFVPTASGGSMIYFDAAAGGAITTVAAAGTLVGDGMFSIKHLSIDGLSVPMVNERGTVVFDAVIANGADERDALLAWTPFSDTPIVVAKTGDVITIGGESRTIGQLGSGGSTFGMFNPFPSELAYDADVLKDGLNDNDFLAFGVRYLGGESGAGTAVLLTQVPEPATIGWLVVGGSMLLMRRRPTRPRLR